MDDATTTKRERGRSSHHPKKGINATEMPFNVCLVACTWAAGYSGSDQRPGHSDRRACVSDASHPEGSPHPPGTNPSTAGPPRRLSEGVTCCIGPQAWLSDRVAGVVLGRTGRAMRSFEWREGTYRAAPIRPGACIDAGALINRLRIPNSPHRIDRVRWPRWRSALIASNIVLSVQLHAPHARSAQQTPPPWQQRPNNGGSTGD